MSILKDDVFIYIPSIKRIIKISEGDGSNLTKEDMENGFVDYIYYSCHKLEQDFPEEDGGIILLEEMFCEMFDSPADEKCINQVLDFIGFKKSDIESKNFYIIMN